MITEGAPRAKARDSHLRWLARRQGDLWYFLWRGFFAVLCRIAFHLTIEGREHEPRQGRFIAAVNHVSAIDPLVAGVALRRRAIFMAKVELFQVPIVGRWIASLGGFPVHRGKPDRQALQHASQVLEQDGVLFMFLEGTRSPDGRLQKAEPGAALLALRTGTPVLPIAVIGSHRILPKGSRRLRFAPVQVRIGPLLTVPKIDGHLNRTVRDQWGERIMAEIGKLLPQDQGGTWTAPHARRRGSLSPRAGPGDQAQ